MLARRGGGGGWVYVERAECVWVFLNIGKDGKPVYLTTSSETAVHDRRGHCAGEFESET